MKLRTSLFIIPIAIGGTLGLFTGCGGDEGEGGAKGTGGDGSGGSDATGGEDGSGGSATGGEGGGGSACDSECADDGDPCTEDVCNPETGECGIPRSGNACDDGVYCNGADTCDEGACTQHAGDPCTETSCNEGKKACECSQVEHCEGGDLSAEKHGAAGEWGTIVEGDQCAYDTTCDEACTCSVSKTTWECVAGTCEDTVSNIVDTTCGSRATEGDSCADNGVFCDGEEKCASGSCQSDASTKPTCPGGDAYCLAAVDRCVSCIPGTFKCEPTGVDSQVISCLSNGEWDTSSAESCFASSNEVCDAETGTCKSTSLSPRDRFFEVPELIRGLPALERGVPTGDALDRVIQSAFG